jgi:CHAT domain-containing protein
LLKRDSAAIYLSWAKSFSRRGGFLPGSISLAEVNLAMAQNWMFFNLDSARNYLRLVEKSRDRWQPEVHYDPSRLALLWANVYRRDGQLDSLYTVSRKGLDLLEEKSLRDDEQLILLKRMMAYFHEERGDYKQALEFYRSARDDSGKKYGPGHFMESVLMVDLANIALYQEKSGEAEDLLLQALTIKMKFHGKYHPGTATTLQSLGITCNQLKKYHDAIRYNKQAIEINDSLYGRDNRWSANVYNNLGQDHLALNNLMEAERCFVKSYHDNLNANGPGSFNLIYPLNNLGDLEMIRDHESKAREYYEEAQYISLKNYGARYRLTIEPQIKLAAIHKSKNEELHARAVIDSAIAAAGWNKSTTLNFTDVSYPMLLIQALSTSADIYLHFYPIDSNTSKLESAFREICRAEAIFDSTHQSFQEDYSSQIFSNHSYRIFDQGIEVAYKLFQLTGDQIYLDAAWQWSEKSKGLLLLEALHESNARLFSGIPEDKIQEASRLQQDMQKLWTQINRSEEQLDRSTILVQNTYRDTKNQYSKLLEDFERDYPRYYQLKYKIPQMNLSRAKSLATQFNASIVEFFWGEDYGYGFLIDRDTTIWYQLHLNELQGDIDLVMKYQVEPNQKQSEEFYNSGYHIFQKLLFPIRSSLKKQMIVIPDGPWYFIPLDLLPVIPPSTAAQPEYLLHHYAINYSHSVAFLDQILENPASKNQGVVYFAPVFPRRNKNQIPKYDLLPDTLIFNLEEIHSLDKIMPGKKIYGRNATEKSFRKIAHEYAVIHLATHAFLGSDADVQAGLSLLPADSLEDGVIGLSDLYAMDLPAEMVVLSACESGKGKWEKGEGIFSLSRGFFYSGTRSILASLWKVNETSTVSLMKHFYTFLDQGYPKPEALQQSKIKYLKEINEPWMGHPYYWAAFTLWGDPDPLQGKGSIHLWILIPGLIIMAIFSLFIIKRKSKQSYRTDP